MRGNIRVNYGKGKGHRHIRFGGKIREYNFQGHLFEIHGIILWARPLSITTV